ncbi:MAG: hypothetical protein VCD00_21010 [Candidatus Hydrogenedentota bacterium]
MSDTTTHRQYAVQCFNECWDYIDKEMRNDEDIEQMLLLVHASLWHWKNSLDSTPENLSVGNWQVSRVYALAGHGELSRKFAQRSLVIARDAELSPFYIGYAYEALARAQAVSGASDHVAEYLAKANAALANVSRDEERELLQADLQNLVESGHNI